MKTLLFIAALMLLGSCVSVSEYRHRLSRYEALEVEYIELKTKKNGLNKEARALEQNLVEIAGLIQKEKDDKICNAAKMNKRLKKLNIESNLTISDIYGMKGLSPFYGEKYYNEFMKNNPNRNPDNARNISWLSDKEKDCYYWLNYARMYPKEFCDKHIIPLLKDPGFESDPHILTLIDYLYQMRPLNALVPDKKAYESAKCHAISCGKWGLVTDIRFNGCKDLKYLECRTYGNYTARAHIIRLLIDRESQCLENRQICFDFLSSVGIAFADHKMRSEMLVLDFSTKEQNR